MYAKVFLKGSCRIYVPAYRSAQCKLSCGPARLARRGKLPNSVRAVIFFCSYFSVADGGPGKAGPVLTSKAKDRACLCAIEIFRHRKAVPAGWQLMIAEDPDQ